MPRVRKLPVLLGWEGIVLSPNLYKTLSSRPQSYSVGVRSPTWIWVRLLSGAPACILYSLVSIVMHTSNHLCNNFPPVLQVRKCTPGKRSTCIWTHANKCPSVKSRVLFVCFFFLDALTQISDTLRTFHLTFGLTQYSHSSNAFFPQSPPDHGFYSS